MLRMHGFPPAAERWGETGVLEGILYVTRLYLSIQDPLCHWMIGSHLKKKERIVLWYLRHIHRAQ